MEPNIQLNFGAIALAALANFLVGFVWYSLLFAKAWRKEIGVDETKEITAYQMLLSLFLSGVGYFLMAFVFTHNIQAWDPKTWGMANSFVTKPQAALMSGVFTWIGFYIPQDLHKVAFQGRTWRLFLIDASYHLVGLLVAAFILVYFT